MGPIDFTPLAYLAVLGLVCIFLVIFPGLGALGWLLFSRLVWGDWNAVYAGYGAAVGLLPALVYAGMSAFFWWQGR